MPFPALLYETAMLWQLICFCTCQHVGSTTARQQLLLLAAVFWARAGRLKCRPMKCCWCTCFEVLLALLASCVVSFRICILAPRRHHSEAFARQCFASGSTHILFCACFHPARESMSAAPTTASRTGLQERLPDPVAPVLVAHKTA